MNFYSHEKIRKLEEDRLNARLAIKATHTRPRQRPSALEIVPGKEEEFRYLQRSLLASEQVDRLIMATEPQIATVAAAEGKQVTLSRPTLRWPLGSAARKCGTCVALDGRRPGVLGKSSAA